MKRRFWAFGLSLMLMMSLAACSGRDDGKDDAGGSGATGAKTDRPVVRDGDTMFDDADYYASGDGDVTDFDYKYPNTTGRSAYNSLQQGLDDMADGVRDAGRAVTDGVRGAGRAVTGDPMER